MTTDWAEHRRALDEWSGALDYSGRKEDRKKWEIEHAEQGEE